MLIKPGTVDPKQILRKEDWIYLFKARLSSADTDREPNDDGDSDSAFTEGWIESEKEEKCSNPFLNLHRNDRKIEERINTWRNSVVEHILCLEDGSLAGLSHSDAVARYQASEMIRAYYRFRVCLQCPKWLEESKIDSRADALLRYLAALVIGLGEPVPSSLQDWASAALLVDRPKRLGRPRKKWRRDQKITLAVDVLVELTTSSVGNALNIVTDVCREKGILDTDLEGIKKIRDRMKKEERKRESSVVS